LKLGLFGGSFDPIHRGHVDTVRAARDAASLDAVWFLPTAVPPHKPERRFAPAWARFAMVELALLDEPGLYASPHELTLDRAAYTVETLSHFRATWPAAELVLLVGADSLATLHTWRRWRELPELAELLVLPRPGFAAEELATRMPEESRWLLASARVRFAAVGEVALSSTALRAALAAGEDPPPGALHPRVLSYLRKYGLYRPAPAERAATAAGSRLPPTAAW
jgi:nicotinate-nucleotide adenylyltransferase